MYSPRQKYYKKTSRTKSHKHYAPSISSRRFNLAYHQQRGLTMDISPSTAKQSPIHMPTFQSTQIEIQKIIQSGILDKMYPDFPGGIMPIDLQISTLDDWNIDPTNPTQSVIITPDLWDQWLKDPAKITSFGFELPPAGWHWVVDIISITYTPFDNSLRNFTLKFNIPADPADSSIYYARILIMRANDLTGVMNPDSDVNFPPLTFVTEDNRISIFEYSNTSQTSWTISKNFLSGIRYPMGELFYENPGYIPYMTNRPEFLSVATHQQLKIELRPDSSFVAELPIVDKFTFQLVGYLAPD